jgi:exopolysaccharide biosynthesis WecB/TagA/CpsF family protein
MNKPQLAALNHTAISPSRRLSRDSVHLAGDLLPLIDFVSVLLSAWFAVLLYEVWFGATAVAAALGDSAARAALAAAVLAPLILCERAYVSLASSGRIAALVRCYCVRFLMFAAVAIGIGIAGRSLAGLPAPWIALWFSGCLAATALTRVLLVGSLQRLQRRGLLRESVAIVGSGAATDRLVRRLQRHHGSTVEIAGVFSDRSDAAAKRAGTSIADLIELGSRHKLDWILLALPASRSDQHQAIAYRLRALAVPVGLCPSPELSAPASVQFRCIGDDLPVRLLAERLRHPQERYREALELILPRWVLLLLGLPLSLLRRLTRPAIAPSKMICTLDDYDLDGFTKVAAGFGQQRYGYVVTPNADHLVRLHHEPSFRALYADAAYVLLDSRFISHLLRFTKKLQLPVCTGSDLTAKLFGEIVQPADRLVLIGGSSEQADFLVKRYGLQQLMHWNPPMGFIHDAEALETSLRFVEANSPFRYCLLALGAPQQEVFAQQLQRRGIARGMALCIGASINFLTGEERRAPRWMQRSGFEWLFRLLLSPGRMAHRYLVRGPQVFGLLRRTEIRLRAASADPRTAAVDGRGYETVVASAPLPEPRSRLPLPRASRSPRRQRATIQARNTLP